MPACIGEACGCGVVKLVEWPGADFCCSALSTFATPFVARAVGGLCSVAFPADTNPAVVASAASLLIGRKPFCTCGLGWAFKSDESLLGNTGDDIRDGGPFGAAGEAREACRAA